MRYKFNYLKYIDWRIGHDRLNHTSLNILNHVDGFSEYDGVDREELCKQGLIILKEWCDEADL